MTISTAQTKALSFRATEGNREIFSGRSLDFARRTRKDLFDMNVPKTITEMSLNVPKKSVELHQNFTETSLELHQNFTENLSDSVLNTFEEIKKNPRATAEALAKILGVSSRTIKTHFSILKDKGLIAYSGSTKSGHWIIKDIAEKD